MKFQIPIAKSYREGQQLQWTNTQSSSSKAPLKEVIGHFVVKTLEQSEFHVLDWLRQDFFRAPTIGPLTS